MPHSVRVAIETLGCKLNQAESEALARGFSSAGYTLVAPHDVADVYILNSCTVTHIADRKSRQFICSARRLNPTALIVATGCYAERLGAELQTAGADVVASGADRGHILDMLRQRLPLTTRESDNTLSRTRAFVKAQDGCNRRCAYCIVPLVRGAEVCVPSDYVIAEIKARVAEGYKEVVLTGTEIGSYLSDGVDIKGLLERILKETGVERLRVSSLQPFEITGELLELWKNQRLCAHFHISLQSGSDSVLKRMKRGYSTAGYENTIGLIRKELPAASITTDIIVGFPVETDAEFLESLDFCRRTGFARIHVFPFSSRPGTAAAIMPAQVPASLKKERSRAMLALAKESAAAFRSKYLGGTAQVLWEQAQAGVWSGYTPNYIRVYTRSERKLTNIQNSVRLTKLYKDGMWGELAGGEEKR